MRKFKLNIIGKSYEIDIEKRKSKSYHVAVNGKGYEATIEDDSGRILLMAVDGGLYNIEVEGEPGSGKMNLKVNDRERFVESKDFLRAKKVITLKKPIVESKGEVLVEGEGSPMTQVAMVSGILAPMPGKVVSVMKNVGDGVKVGDVVLILEAMKMENEITSNRDGKVTEIRVKEGDNVDADDVLVVIA